MVAKIRNYIQRAFDDVPKTKKAMELQEELIANCLEKFNDQLRFGKSEEEAYTAVISGIGDLSELTEGLKERHTLSVETPEQRKKSAVLVATAVMLYILSPMMVVFFSEVVNQSVIGVLMMFTFVAIATGLLVYNAMTKSRYLREEETLVEEFKEWKSAKAKDRAIFETVSSAYWLIVVGIYLFISFTTLAWHYTWIIFIIAAAIGNIVKAILLWRQSDETQ